MLEHSCGSEPLPCPASVDVLVPVRAGGGGGAEHRANSVTGSEVSAPPLIGTQSSCVFVGGGGVQEQHRHTPRVAERGSSCGPAFST